MSLKLVLMVGLLTDAVFAADVPADLTVKAFTGSALDKAVRKALDGKAASQSPTLPNPFPTEELRRALSALARIEEQCAIPLREVRGGNGHIMDPLAKPAGNGTFDPMAKAAPIGPCYFDTSIK